MCGCYIIPDISDVNHDTHFVLVIDRRHPYTDLMKKIEIRVKTATEDGWNDTVDMPIREETKRKVGAKEWKQSYATYPFSARPNTKALELVLLIHDINRDHPDWKQWRIGVEAKTKSAKLLPLMKLVEGDAEAEPTASQKIIIQAAVGRELKKAQKIKAGIIKGIFPAT